MKDEIKEILYELNDIFQLSELEQQVKDIEKLLDYITNLQTIEQQYSAILSENAELENKITNLQEENIHLDKVNCHLRKKINNETYKSRNEKAIEDIDLVIELIKQQPTGDDTWILNRLNGFKYLLQGEDKDVKD